MKAISATKYGPPEVLQMIEVPTPVPKDHEVLIKVHAATVTAGDCEIRRFQIPVLFWLFLRINMMIRNPKKILGQELAGEIAGTGKNVTRFKKGDKIFAPTEMKLAAYAEYICLPADKPIGIKSANISFEAAATIPTGGLNALHFIRKAKIQPGDKVLINGAGGSIGTYAIQLAKLEDAEVTAVDSDIKLDTLRTTGADHVIDYQKEDFTQSRKTYDVIIDVVGKSHYSRSIKCLNPKGRYILGNPSISGMLRAPWTTLRTDKQVKFELAVYRQADMDHLRELMVTGKLKAVIDKTYPLGELAKAHEYVDAGLKKGNVVIKIPGDE